MKFRRKTTGEVKTLELERYRGVSLTNVDDWFDVYHPETDSDCLELIEATPNERRALRRAGFNIERAERLRENGEKRC